MAGPRVHLEAVLPVQLEGENRVVWIQFLDDLRAIVLLAGREDADLKLFLKPIQHFHHMRSDLQIDAIIAILSAYLYGLSPIHVFLLGVPVHHLSVDQSLIQVKHNRDLFVALRRQLDGLWDVLRDWRMREVLKG